MLDYGAAGEKRPLALRSCHYTCRACCAGQLSNEWSAAAPNTWVFVMSTDGKFKEFQTFKHHLRIWSHCTNIYKSASKPVWKCCLWLVEASPAQQNPRIGGKICRPPLYIWGILGPKPASTPSDVDFGRRLKTMSAWWIWSRADSPSRRACERRFRLATRGVVLEVVV